MKNWFVPGPNKLPTPLSDIKTVKPSSPTTEKTAPELRAEEALQQKEIDRLRQQIRDGSGQISKLRGAIEAMRVKAKDLLPDEPAFDVTAVK